MFKILFVLCAVLLEFSTGDSCAFSKNDKNIVNCCKTIFDLAAEDKELNKAGSKCTASSANSDYCSLFKCIMNYQGTLYADKLNVTNIVSTLLRGKDEAVWGKVIDEASKTCLTKMDGKECPELYFLDCIDVNMFVNCPKSEWNEDETCVEIKKSFSTC